MYFIEFFQGYGLSSEAAVEYAVKAYSAEIITYAAIILAVIIVVCISLVLIFRRR